MRRLIALYTSPTYHHSPGASPCAGAEQRNRDNDASGGDVSNIPPAQPATATGAYPTSAPSTERTPATSSGDTGSTWTEDRLRELLGSSKRVLSDVCEEMHSRLSKLILARKHEQTDLSISVDMFVSEFRVVFTFIEATEAVNGKPCATLRGTVGLGGL